MADISRGHNGIKKIVAISRYVAVQAQAWVTQNLFGVQGVVHPTPPDTTKIFRAPVATSVYTRPAFAQPTLATNLLLTTLAVTGAAPFAQANWPNPTTRQAPHVGFVRGMMPPPAPFAQAEWPNPTLATPRQQPANSLNILRTTLGPAPTKTATLQDTFNAGHNTTLWDATQDPGSTVTFIRNRVEIQAPTGLGDPSYGYLYSKSGYDLTDSSAHVEVVQSADAVEADIAGTGLSLILDRNNSTRYALGIAVYPDYILFYRFVNGAYADSAAALPYDPVAHRWLRIQHSGTTVYWDTSADGVSWTNRASWVPSFYVWNLYVQLYSGLEANAASSPTLGVFDNFNTGADPFAQFDWANPLRPRILTEGFSGSKTAEAVVVAAPFTQTEWPNPIHRVRQVVPLSHRYAGEPAVAEASKPFLQSDWQNPRVNPAYRQFLNSGRVLGEDPFPFTQTEWPNPLLKQRVHQGLIASQSLTTADLPKPFLHLDWPNPILAIPVPHSGFVHPLPYEVFIIVPPPVTTRNRVFGMGRGYSNT